MIFFISIGGDNIIFHLNTDVIAIVDFIDDHLRHKRVSLIRVWRNIYIIYPKGTYYKGVKSFLRS